MKKVSLLVVVICMMACKQEVKTLPLNEFETSVQQSNAVLLDVRTWDEYASGHIVNAINIDWKSDNFEQQFAELDLDKNQAIAVYCLHAKRSQNAAECIIDMGYPNVFQLEEGIEPWTELELVKEFANKDLIGVWQVCKVDSIDGLIIDKICRSVGEAIPPTNRHYRPRVIFREDGTMSASAGGNNICGGYAFERHNLNIKLGSQTLMRCGFEFEMYESGWFSFLNGSTEIRPCTMDSILLFKNICGNRNVVLRKIE